MIFHTSGICFIDFAHRERQNCFNLLALLNVNKNQRLEWVQHSNQFAGNFHKDKLVLNHLCVTGMHNGPVV